MSKVEIEFPSIGEDGAPHPIYLGTVMVGNGMCRMFLETDGKVYLYCPHSSKEFVRFGREYKEGEMFSFGGDSDEQG